MQDRNLNEIDTIVVHCSYTKPSMQFVDADWIRQIHVVENKWDDIGYEAVIKRGDNPRNIIEGGRPFEYVPAHTFGHNRNSLGICLVGGMNESGKPDCNFTAGQFEALADLLHAWIIRFRIKRVVGHRDLDASKDCPCFDAYQFAAAEVEAFGGR